VVCKDLEVSRPRFRSDVGEEKEYQPSKSDKFK